MLDSHRSTYLTARPEWAEMDSEMPFNKSRTYTFHRDQLSCFQLGSAALGITVSEEADRGLGNWDVYRYCEVCTSRHMSASHAGLCVGRKPLVLPGGRRMSMSAMRGSHFPFSSCSWRACKRSPWMRTP